MSLDELLRDYARQDLQRFCPPAHFWNRDHAPIAYMELAWPLLRAPAQLGLTPRERVAATALNNWATYSLRSRAIWAAAYPARDIGDQTPVVGMSFDQEREIWGRYEVFRDSALVYARMLNDAQLIEHYQTPVPPPIDDAAPAPETATPQPEQEAPAQEGVAVVAERASDAPLPKPTAIRYTWLDVSRAYIVEVMQAGQYATAKELYRALETKAGGSDSPFDKGIGNNRGSLFVRGIERPLSLKTVQNKWQTLLELAKK